MSGTAQVNGPQGSERYLDGVDPEDPAYIKNLQRPAEVKEDIHQMENRSRVKVVLNSECFKEELEQIVDEQIRNGPYPASLLALQQINELLMPASRGGLNNFARASTVIPINDLKSTDNAGFVKGEKLLRCKVAALYRLVDLHGWSEGIYNHISARVSSEDEHFLLNPFGMTYPEVTASSLIKVDVNGDIVDPGTSHFGVSKAGFTLHSAIHQARPDIKCIIHLHTPNGIAVSAMKCGVLPLCQEAIFLGNISYHDYHGVLVDDAEREKIARDLGVHNKVMVLRNHGVIACGETVEEAFYFATNLMTACDAQVRAIPVGLDNLWLPSEEVAQNAAKIGNTGGGGVETQGKKWRVGELEFEALMRQLDNSGYRSGYMYKVPMIKQDKKDRTNSEVEIPPSSSSFTYVFDGDLENSKYVSPLKMAQDRQKKAFKAGWLTSPNAYKKKEVEEIGTTTPKKITKWVSEDGDSPNKPGCVQVKLDHPNQFAPQGENPKELKQKQKSIRKDYYEDKLSAGPQSKILDGMSWDEAQQAKDGQLSGAGDQVIVVGAASKGIIQRDHQHNAVVYRQYYAANPFENMSEAEIENYQDEVQHKEPGQPAESAEPQNEVEEDSNKRQEAQDTEVSQALSLQREYNGIPEASNISQGYDDKGQDAVLARLANSVVQTVMHEALAVVRRLGGKGQQILTGSTADSFSSAQKQCTESSLYTMGGQIENSDKEKKRVDRDINRSEKENISKGSGLMNRGKERSNKKPSQYSKLPDSGVYEHNRNEEGSPHVNKSFPSTSAPSASIRIDEESSRGDMVTVHINPITVQHSSCQADGMKIRFSVHSTVRRKVRAEIQHDSPIQEVFAHATQPTVQLIHTQQRSNVVQIPVVCDEQNTKSDHVYNDSVTPTEMKVRSDINANSNVSNSPMSSNADKQMICDCGKDSEERMKREKNEEILEKPTECGATWKAKEKEKQSLPTVDITPVTETGSQEQYKALEDMSNVVHDRDVTSGTLKAKLEPREVLDNVAEPIVASVKSEVHDKPIRPTQLHPGYKKRIKSSKRSKLNMVKKSLAPLSPVREIAYEGTESEMNEMGEILDAMDDSFERLLLTAEDDLLLCEREGNEDLDLSEFKGIDHMTVDDEVLTKSQKSLQGIENQINSCVDGISYPKISETNLHEVNPRQKVVQQSQDETNINVDDIFPQSQRRTETSVDEIVPQSQRKTESSVYDIFPQSQRKTETSVDDIVPQIQRKTETSVDEIVPQSQRKTESSVYDIFPQSQRKTETSVDEIVPQSQRKTESSVYDIFPQSQRKTETSVDDIVPQSQRKTETSVDDIVPQSQRKIETSVDDIVPHSHGKTETNVDDIILSIVPQSHRKTQTTVDDIDSQSESETEVVPQNHRKTETNVDDIDSQSESETDVVPQNHRKTETNVDDIVPQSQRKTETNVDDIDSQSESETEVVPQSKRKTETNVDDIDSQSESETEVVPQNHRKTETNVDDIVPQSQRKTETNVDDIDSQSESETEVVPQSQRKTETNVDDIDSQSESEIEVVPQNHRKTETNVDDIVPQSQRKTETNVDDIDSQSESEIEVVPQNHRKTETNVDDIDSPSESDTEFDPIVSTSLKKAETRSFPFGREMDASVDEINSHGFEKIVTSVDDIGPQSSVDKMANDHSPHVMTETNIDELMSPMGSETNADDFTSQVKMETNIDDVISYMKPNTSKNESFPSFNVHSETSIEEPRGNRIETPFDAFPPPRESGKSAGMETNVDDIIPYDESETEIEDSKFETKISYLSNEIGDDVNNGSGIMSTPSIGKKGMKFMFDDSMTSEGPIQTSSPKIGRVKRPDLDKVFHKDLHASEKILLDSMSYDKSSMSDSKSQPLLLDLDLPSKDDTFLTRSSSYDYDCMKDTQMSKLLRDNKFEEVWNNEKDRPSSPVYHSSRSILDEYHLKKHNELMELPSAKSFLTSPKLPFQGSTSDIMPPLPDTEDVPSISDIEDADLPVRRNQRYRSSQKDNRSIGPRHDDVRKTVPAKSRWVPKSKRVPSSSSISGSTPDIARPVSERVEKTDATPRGHGSGVGLDSKKDGGGENTAAGKGNLDNGNKGKKDENVVSNGKKKEIRPRRQEGGSEEEDGHGERNKERKQKNKYHRGEEDSKRNLGSKYMDDEEKHIERRARNKQEKSNIDKDERNKERQPRKKKDSYNEYDSDERGEKMSKSGKYRPDRTDDERSKEKRSKTKIDRYDEDDDYDDRRRERRSRRKNDSYDMDDDERSREKGSRSKKDRYDEDDSDEKSRERGSRRKKDIYDKYYDGKSREKNAESNTPDYDDKRRKDNRSSNKREKYNGDDNDERRERRSKNKNDRYDKDNDDEKSKEGKRRSSNNKYYKYEDEKEDGNYQKQDRSKKNKKKSLDLGQDNLRQERITSKGDKVRDTELGSQTDVRTRKIGRVSDGPLIANNEKNVIDKSLEMSKELGSSTPNLVDDKRSGLLNPVIVVPPEHGASPRLSRRRGGAIAPNEEKLKKMNNPYKNTKNHLFVPLGASGNHLNRSLRSVHKSSASLASSTLSRRSKSSSRIFENCPELLPPVPQINPLTGEPYHFVHPLMSKSMESLRSRQSYHSPDMDRTRDTSDWKSEGRGIDSFEDENNNAGHNVKKPVDSVGNSWDGTNFEEPERKEDKRKTRSSDHGDDIADKKGDRNSDKNVKKKRDSSDGDNKRSHERGEPLRKDKSDKNKPTRNEHKNRDEKYADASSNENSIGKGLPSYSQKPPTESAESKSVERQIDVAESAPNFLSQEPESDDSDQEPELPPKKGLLSRLSCVGGKSSAIAKKKEDAKTKAPLENRATVDDSGNQKDFFAAEKKRMKKLAKEKEDSGLYFQDEDNEVNRANDTKTNITDHARQADSATFKPFSTFAAPSTSSNTQGYNDYFEEELEATKKETRSEAKVSPRETLRPPKLSSKSSHFDEEDSHVKQVRRDKESPERKSYKEDEFDESEKKWQPRARRDKVSPLRPSPSKSPENPRSPHYRRDSADHRDTFNSTLESDIGVFNSSAPAHLSLESSSHSPHITDTSGNLMDPSTSFDASELPHYYKKRTRRESIDMDSSFPATGTSPLLKRGEKSPVRRRMSQVSIGGMESGTMRTRSSSTSSNPLIYQPWRSQRKPRGRSMSISEMVYAAGVARPSRSHSVGEITYNDSLLGQLAGGRRRSRTNSIGEIAITSRMYHRRRSRSHSRASLGDTSFGSVAPGLHQRRQSGTWSSHPAELDVAPVNAAPVPVKRTESAREPSKNPQLIDELGRKNVERTKSDRQPHKLKEELGEDKPVSPSKSDTLKSTDSASGGETLEERSSKEGSPTKEHPTTKDKKGKKKKFRIPSFSKKKNKESKESAI